MAKLEKLRYGDSIGVFSPACPIGNLGTYDKAKKYLENKGYKIVEGNLTRKSDYYRSGSIRERAEELNDLIRNPDIKCIISTIGGMNSNSLLPYIDYEAFTKSPKIVIGYSDVTAILLGIHAKTGISTFYGPPVAEDFWENTSLADEIYEKFENMLVKNQKIPYEISNKEWTSVIQGTGKGRLIGGNWDTILGFWGSEFMPEIKDGDILFVEDQQNPSTLERSCSFLKVNGVFDKISGIILSKHELYDDEKTGRKPYEVLLEVLDGKELPIIADFDSSHNRPMVLPIGCNIEMDSTNKKITILEDCFG
ncbi:muramoyltetrapeptide carboxypeptidase LdcA involved in peptidoglycan recycling [Acetoanaerobium pronyense]|uniref:Muramoyltetrapeptide carboxypeptidase LdcA involved in peptidoglycan recycling n=1 Tax=Acetoanaerobium pronyense TaxID=1482736 RepID=A0ABS4KL61_9FIRM|nr:S66 peptidase family protein [Acetoanaerobium pronyense]MBP2028532.1 muramoyltetrapeptide carboxypeptidase LdcA involved in peptidoglycan recycling [Acetoanaerobium pronyense]